MMAIGRTNDAILYGGMVKLEVDCDDDVIQQLGPKTPSCASPDYGRPFGEIFTRYDSDFYRIDPLLFSPAQIVFENARTGSSKHEFGTPAPDVLSESFGAKK
jgi:methenyltetrahydromethanopterin cyclohydrolase